MRWPLGLSVAKENVTETSVALKEEVWRPNAKGPEVPFWLCHWHPGFTTEEVPTLMALSRFYQTNTTKIYTW